MQARRSSVFPVVMHMLTRVSSKHCVAFLSRTPELNLMRSVVKAKMSAKSLSSPTAAAFPLKRDACLRAARTDVNLVPSQSVTMGKMSYSKPERERPRLVRSTRAASCRWKSSGLAGAVIVWKYSLRSRSVDAGCFTHAVRRAQTADLALLALLGSMRSLAAYHIFRTYVVTSQQYEACMSVNRGRNLQGSAGSPLQHSEAGWLPRHVR